jgi:hypothetical protein
MGAAINIEGYPSTVEISTSQFLFNIVSVPDLQYSHEQSQPLESFWDYYSGSYQTQVCVDGIVKYRLF